MSGPFGLTGAVDSSATHTSSHEKALGSRNSAPLRWASQKVTAGTDFVAFECHFLDFPVRLSKQEEADLAISLRACNAGGRVLQIVRNELLFSFQMGLSIKAPSPAFRKSDAVLPSAFSSCGSSSLTDFKSANSAATSDLPATPRATSRLNLSNSYFSPNRNHNQFASPSAPPKGVVVETRLGLFGIPRPRRFDRLPAKRKLFGSHSKLGFVEINALEWFNEAVSKDTAAFAKPPSNKASSDNFLETASSPTKDAVDTGDPVGTEPQPIEESKSVNQPKYTAPRDSIATFYVGPPLIALPASGLILNEGSSVSSRDGSASLSTDGSTVSHMSMKKLRIVLDIGKASGF
eukprot:gene6109-2711_t